jgi:hypothetical protein
MAPLSWRRLLSAALAAAFLAAPVRAAEVEASAPRIAAPVAVYPAPQSWGAALPHIGALTGVPGLDGANAQALAPITHALSAGLGVDERQFAAMTPADQKTSVHLALEAARQELTQKSYELVGEAKARVWATDGITKSDLDALYPLAAQLREIDRNYGPLLDEHARQLVSASAAQAADAWRAARAAYVARFGEATAKGLRTGKEAEASGAVSVRKAPRPLNPSNGARKLLERMRSTKSGWGEKDLEAVYLGYGFTFRDGAKHRMYTHPDFPQLHTTVSRQRDLPPGYAQEAVKLIAELEALSAPAGLPAAEKTQEDDLPPPIQYASAEKEQEPSAKSERSPKPRRAETRPPATLAAVEAPLEPAPVEALPAAAPARVERTAPAASPAKQEPPAPPTVASNKFSQAKFEPSQVQPAPKQKKLSWWERFWSRD